VTGVLPAGNIAAALSSTTSVNGTTIPASQTLVYAGGPLGTPSSGTATNLTGYTAAHLPTITLTGDTTGAASGGSIATTTVKINGTAFSGTSGDLVSFGAGNTPADSAIAASNVALLNGTQSFTGLNTFGTNISIGGVQPTGATGTGNIVFSASPTLTGTATIATLAATTINGAALSGTFSGNATFSGNLTMSGGLTFSGLGSGTQVSCLGLTSLNVVVPATGACGSGGGGSGTVTSVGLAGTLNQITITGASPITASGSWTAALSSTLVLPGTLTAAALSTSGTIGGSVCATSAGLILYEAALPCEAPTFESGGAGGVQSNTLNIVNGGGIAATMSNVGGVATATLSNDGTLQTILGGIAGTGGSCTAISATGGSSGTLVASLAVLTAYTNNTCYEVAVTDANVAASATLNIQSVGAVPLVYMAGTVVTAIPAGALRQNVPYIYRYSAAGGISGAAAFFVYPDGYGSIAWNQIGNPSGSLSLNMSTFTSTFNTTSALSQLFAWKNTTPATSSTSQGSPVLANCGRAWIGSDTEACSTWSILPGNGSNAALTVTFGVSGSSTGITTTVFPGPITSGTDNSIAGQLQTSNGSANAHTIWGSAATTTNTILGFATVPTTGHVVTCTVSGSTCTLTDGGAPGVGTVTSVSFTGGIVSVATATTTPAFTVAGTSGGVVYFSSTSGWASSGLLGSTCLVVGGGAGTAPATGSCDFTYTSRTLTGDSGGLVDFSAMSATSGLKIPIAAGAVPTVDGYISTNSTNHTLVYGSNGTTLVSAVAATGTGTATTCSNQLVSAISGIAAPTCTTVTASYTNNTIAQTGVDINTSFQVTVTHLAAALPTAQGGTNCTTASITCFNNITGYTASGATGTTSTNVVFSTSPTLVTPVLGAATATSLLASGIVDGKAPVTITTSASCTLGTASGCNATAYDSGYTYNQEATAATAITYTLPTAAAGLQYCVGNSYNGSAATTGTIELLTSAAGQYIIFTDGTLSATGGYVISGGAARDSACVVGTDSTHWTLYVYSGTWTKH
jgi:hypothetical protein